MEAFVLEKAFRTGWQEIYELADRYFNEADDEYLALMHDVSRELKTDHFCLNSESWNCKFDQTCKMVTKLMGMSELKKFICVPFCLEEDIALLPSAEAAFEAGRRAAFDRLSDTWNRFRNVKQQSNEEDELFMEGAMSLLSAVASETGYKIVVQGGNADENVTA